MYASVAWMIDLPRPRFGDRPMRGLTLLCTGLVLLPALHAQTPTPQILIKAGRLVDGRSAAAQTNVGILIDGERIRAVGPLGQIQGQAPNARVIDLSQMTVLPGLIDAHTHLLLQGDVTSQDYEDQQLKHGADWIKYYSDRRYYFTPDSVLHSWVNFTDAEAKAIVDETHRMGHMVAAHAIGSDGIAAALRAGDGRRGISVDRDQSGEGIRVLRAVRHDADAGDSVRNLGCGRAAGPGAELRCDRPRTVR